MNTVSLSIIIPIYNTPIDLLTRCINSIKEDLIFLKNSEQIEILLINDGSTEPHIEKCLKEYTEMDNCFRYINKPNSGVSNTRNLGIDLAKGNYIAFVDADDYLEPHALQYMLTTIRDSGMDMVMFGFCWGEKKYCVTKFVKIINVDNDVIRNLICDNQEWWLAHGFFFSTVWAKIFKREVLLKNKIKFHRDITIYEDSIFILNLISHISSFLVDNTLVYHYVYNTDSAVHKLSTHEIQSIENLVLQLEILNKELIKKRGENFDSSIRYRVLQFIKASKWHYFTHPQNKKSFGELRKELNKFLRSPTIYKYIKELRTKDALNFQDKKSILLLKLHLYGIFLLIERQKRKYKATRHG